MSGRYEGGNHYHGSVLAGIGAGSMAVLVAGGAAMLLVRRQLGEVLTVVAWSLAAAVVLLVLAAAVYVMLWLRHKASELRPVPLPVMTVPAMTAEIVSGTPAALPAAAPRAIEAPHVSLHVPEGISAEAAAALASGLLRQHDNPEGN